MNIFDFFIKNIEGIPSSAFSSAATFITTISYQKLKVAYDFYRVNSVLPLANRNVAIVFSSKIYKPYKDDIDHGHAVDDEEELLNHDVVYAFEEFIAKLSKYQPKWSLLSSKRDFSSQDAIICIGGPENNNATFHYLKEYHPLIFINREEEASDTRRRQICMDSLPMQTALIIGINHTITLTKKKQKIILICGRQTADTNAASIFLAHQMSLLSNFTLFRKDIYVKSNDFKLLLKFDMLEGKLKFDELEIEDITETDWGP